MNILLAVSGGIDSMYLAERAGEIFPGAAFAVAHCNFSLRGEESDGDEEFVRGWCEAKGLPCMVRRFDTRQTASERGLSIEMAARDLRYGWFAELCRDFGYDAVAVAHNADDNAETMILNLVRGTGCRGLRGMSERSGSGGCTVLRPLLDTSREEIRQWMEREGKRWREDSTNSDTAYKRNRIRHEVMPAFRQMNPSYLKTLRRDMRHIAQEDDIAEDYFRSCVTSTLEEGVNLRELMRHKHWEWLLYRLCEPYNLSEETLGKLADLLRSGRTISSKVFQSPSHLLEIKGKMLTARERKFAE